MLALLVSVALLVSQGPAHADTTRISEPTVVSELDMGKLKGEPARLAWSPDGSEIYVQTLEGGFGRPGAKTRHYVFTVATGAMKGLDTEPEWAAAYWTMKSGQTSPDGPPLKIELQTTQRLEKTTSVPRGGDLARGGTTTDPGTSASDGVAAAYGSQAVTVHSMVLRGETIGEFVNSVIVPGLTFGWGPKGTRMIAFTDVKNGRVIIMDEEGKKKDVAGSKDAVLPAWSPNGDSLAWLQKDGRRKFRLQVARVSAVS